VSREQAETVRRIFETFNETGDIQAVLPFHAEDLVVESMREWPDDPVYHGREGLAKLARQWQEMFDDFGFEIADVRDGDRAVVALLDMTGTVKGSDVQMATHIGAVVNFREDLVSQISYFSDWEEALEVAGAKD
jgi:ketosteroid isomerase-like protein